MTGIIYSSTIHSIYLYDMWTRVSNSHEVAFIGMMYHLEKFTNSFIEVLQSVSWRSNFTENWFIAQDFPSFSPPPPLLCSLCAPRLMKLVYVTEENIDKITRIWYIYGHTALRFSLKRYIVMPSAVERGSYLLCLTVPQ